MTAAIAHAALPMAVFRGPLRDCIASSPAWRELFGDELQPRLRDVLADAERSRERRELSVRDEDRALRVIVDPLPADELLVTCLDETELVRARAEAESARREREQLVAAVSHDLRAPMSTILLWERVLRDRFQDPDIRDRALDAIRDSATAQSGLVAQLVEVSSLMSGTSELASEHIALDALLASAIDLHWSPARSKAISLEPDYAAPLGFIDADPKLLRQVFGKVLETLVRVSPQGTTVAIRARQEASSVVIKIGPASGVHATGRAQQIATLDIGLIMAAELVAMHAGTFEAVRIDAVPAPTFVISLPMSAGLASQT